MGHLLLARERRRAVLWRAAVKAYWRNGGRMLRRITGNIALGLIVAGLIGWSLQTAAAARPRPKPQPRAQAPIPAGAAMVTINEQLLAAMLEAAFTLPRKPSFPLIGRGSNGRSEDGSNSCPSEITLERELNGVKTALHFEDGRIIAPIAFTGSYEAALVGCLIFRGVADTVINLEFDRAREALVARIDVRQVRLTDVPPLLNTAITGMVQSAIDARVNPFAIFRAAQLSTRFPVSGTGGALHVRAKDIRPEIVRKELRLYITYEVARVE
jgi:hypothetical protein